jgi:hypothetical protein
MGLAVATALLAGWVILLTFLGYLISGILMFFVVSLVLRQKPLRLRDVAVDAALSAAIVGGVYWAFTNLLFVPLPPGPF